VLPFYQQLFNLADGFGGIQSLWTGAGTIHNGMAAIQFKWILQIIQALTGGLVTAVSDPSVGLQ